MNKKLSTLFFILLFIPFVLFAQNASDSSAYKQEKQVELKETKKNGMRHFH